MEVRGEAVEEEGEALPGVGHRQRAVADLRGTGQVVGEEGVDLECSDLPRLAAGLPVPPVWLHADLSPGNILLTDDGRLGGVIDFGCMGLGEPAVDLIAAWNLFTGPAREAFRAAVTGGDDDAAWARGRGWALSISLIQLPYYRHTNPVMVASSKFVIDEVLAGG